MIKLYRRVKVYLSQACPAFGFTLSTQKYVGQTPTQKLNNSLSALLLHCFIRRAE
jgi:hypothetical protein